MNYKTKNHNNYRSQDLTGFKNLSGLTATVNTKKPLFFSQINPDLYFVGFEISATDAKGSSTPNTTNPGWFVCFEERAGEIVFGADEERASIGDVVNWDELSWNDIFLNESKKNFINASKTINVSDLEAKKIIWGSNSADLSYALYQKPSRVFIHSNDMLS